ncbi:predicted protein [Phaeodactylum tricornutum CCAP 1055/1]|uniref:HSF-type DNA-binding domain-containing protein n=1 Tax=Phaeodactylum tricornutum (strain CCAP 1055/1) TaxID=556484 RepID=B7G9L5_PHATC|nr:predicted protein [Phaeodactylum tricornutum CCAP 1055/1]EEC44463.1 predicted protein [Phaeodactylum tricornutum CCAP 1055/1]|eukprot:XP_002183794.1 predicted protein [Phaeodactylum tricornutum CCAP 1055/1]
MEDSLGYSQSPFREASFPVKLHHMLTSVEEECNQGIVSWQPHGRAFLVFDIEAFVNDVLPKWFRQTKFQSFQRQLNIYNFKRISVGRDKGSYYHEFFLRGQPHLAANIPRIKLKGTSSRKPLIPPAEPDFYSMPYLGPIRGPADPNDLSSVAFSASMIAPPAYHLSSFGTSELELLVTLRSILSSTPPPAPSSAYWASLQTNQGSGLSNTWQQGVQHQNEASALLQQLLSSSLSSQVPPASFAQNQSSPQDFLPAAAFAQQSLTPEYLNVALTNTLNRQVVAPTSQEIASFLQRQRNLPRSEPVPSETLAALVGQSSYQASLRQPQAFFSTGQQFRLGDRNAEGHFTTDSAATAQLGSNDNSSSGNVNRGSSDLPDLARLLVATTTPPPSMDAVAQVLLSGLASAPATEVLSNRKKAPEAAPTVQPQQPSRSS